MLFDVLVALFAILLLGYAGWFLYEFIRYLVSGEYHVDKRFREVTR